MGLGGENAIACLSYDMSVNFHYPIIIITIYYLTAVSINKKEDDEDVVSVLIHIS